MKTTNRLFSLGFACSLLFGAMAGSSALGSIVNLGDASGFTVFTTGNVNSTNSTFQDSTGNAATFGFGGSNFTENGSGQQQQQSVYYNPGASVTYSGVQVTQNQNAAFVTQAGSDASTACSTLAGLTPTLNCGNLGATTITLGNTVGNYVLNCSGINLNQGSFTICAPTGSTCVVNVNGSISLNGWNQNCGLNVGGGLSSCDVIYNICGSGHQVTSNCGQGYCNDIQGSIFDCHGNVNLGPCEVDGQVICQNFNCNCGKICRPCPTPPLCPVPEANAGWILGGLFPLMLLLTPARLRKARAALRSRTAATA